MHSDVPSFQRAFWRQSIAGSSRNKHEIKRLCVDFGNITILHVNGRPPLTVCAFLCFHSWLYSVHRCCVVLFCLSHLRKGDDTSFSFYVFRYLFFSAVLFIVALSTLPPQLQRSTSMSWFCDHKTYIFLGGGVVTDTVSAGCWPVERTVNCEEHTQWRTFVCEIITTIETDTYAGIPGETADHSRCGRRANQNVKVVQPFFCFRVRLVKINSASLEDLGRINGNSLFNWQ